jgi:hypothetical protein
MNLLFKILVFWLIYFQFANADWILDIPQEKKGDIWAVVPKRVDGKVIDIESKQLKLFRNNNRINNYEVELKVDGQYFNFDKKDIGRFYLRSDEQFYNLKNKSSSLGCKNGFFMAVVKGQKKDITYKTKNIIKALTGTWFQTKYIKLTEVFGKKKTQTKKKNIEVWGLANSKKNADHIVEYYKKDIMNNIFIFFDLSNDSNSKKINLFGDIINANINMKYTEVQTDKGSFFNEKMRSGYLDISLQINNHIESWRSNFQEYKENGNWGWSCPNTDRKFKIENDRIVRVYFPSCFWRRTTIQFMIDHKWKDLNLSQSNVKVPECDTQ